MKQAKSTKPGDTVANADYIRGYDAGQTDQLATDKQHYEFVIETEREIARSEGRAEMARELAAHFARLLAALGETK